MDELHPKLCRISSVDQIKARVLAEFALPIGQPAKVLASLKSVRTIRRSSSPSTKGPLPALETSWFPQLDGLYAASRKSTEKES